MLEEALRWLCIDTSKHAQCLGYRKEAAAPHVRHRRCTPFWRTHLETTRQALMTSAALSYGSGGFAVVMGAGMVRDIPWQQLLEGFDEIHLVDIAFHPEARALHHRYRGRVQLCEMHITDYVTPLARHPKRVPEMKVMLPRNLVQKMGNARWVASVNLLTQLPLVPCAWLLRPGVAQHVVEAVGMRILHAHLQSLRAASSTVCVVAEVRDTLGQKSGEIVDTMERSTFIQSALRPRAWHVLDRWLWTVNPPGELPGAQNETRELECIHMDAL